MSVGHLGLFLLSVCLSVPVCCLSVCQPNIQSNQSAVRGRNWGAHAPGPAPYPSPSPSSCTPWAPFTATVILLSPTCLPAYNLGTVPIYCTLTVHVTFPCSNSIFFFPPFLSSTRHSCPVLHLSSYPSLLFPLDGPGAYALSWPDTNSTSIRDPGAVRVERSRLGIYNLQLKEPGRCSSTAEPCPAATAALIEQRATNATRARLARF